MTQLRPGDIEEIIRDFEASELATLEIRVGDADLFLSRDSTARPTWAGQDARPAPAAPNAPPADAETPTPGVAPEAPEIPPGHIVVAAPSMGTFYRAEKPGAPPYVKVGQDVTPDSEVGLVEVMKLFTTVRAGVRGRVARILVGDAAPITLGQPLILIEVHE